MFRAARHWAYDSATLGTSLSVDPVVGRASDPQSWSPYTYVRNNPLRFVDPTGERNCSTQSCSGDPPDCDAACGMRAAYAAFHANDGAAWAASTPDACYVCQQWVAAANAYAQAAAAQAWTSATNMGSGCNVCDAWRSAAKAYRDAAASTSGGGSGGLLGAIGAVAEVAANPWVVKIELGALVGPAAFAGVVALSATIPNDSGPARPVVIGEDMRGRVIPAALAQSAQWYPGTDVHGNNFDQAMMANRIWINGMMDTGRRIIDIGIDPGRDPADRSPFYAMEKEEIGRRGYTNIQEQKGW